MKKRLTILMGLICLVIMVNANTAYSESIQLSSPNGGENWIHGDLHSITWTTSGVTRALKVSLKLFQGNSASTCTIASSIPSTSGSYSWKVGNCSDGTKAPAGNDYKIMIEAMASRAQTISDVSDSAFTISLKQQVLPVKPVGIDGQTVKQYADAARDASSKCPPLTITTASLPPATVGTPYNTTLQASGGQAPMGWGYYAGSLPQGLIVDLGGVISGTPTASGNYSFRAQVWDKCQAGQQVATKALSMVVAPAKCAPLTITTASPLPSAATGKEYNIQFQASGGQAPVLWGVTSGSLPPSLGMNKGVISGTPTASGNYSFTVQARDNCAAGVQLVRKDFSMTVDEPTLVSAEIIFDTTSNDKDFDSMVHVYVNSSKTEVVLTGDKIDAYIAKKVAWTTCAANGTKFPDNTTTTLGLSVDRDIKKSECRDLNLIVGFKTVGRDTWRFKSKAVLHFSDGSQIVKMSNGVSELSGSCICALDSGMAACDSYDLCGCDFVDIVVQGPTTIQ
jgi:hypothetical protein